MSRRSAVCAVALLVGMGMGLAACGEDAPAVPEPKVVETPEPESLPPPEPPPWPELSKEQHEEAERLGVPVKFENDLRMRFVLVPAGLYVIYNEYAASPAEAKAKSTFIGDGRHIQGPMQAEIEKAFYVQITEVTIAQYRQRHPSGPQDRRWRHPPRSPRTPQV